jgi:hypothetical protein
MAYYMQDDADFYTSSEAGSEYDEYFADEAEDEIVQVLDELRLTINNQTQHQHEQEEYQSAQQSARQIVLKKSHQEHNLAYSVKQKILNTQETKSIGNIKAKACK